MTTRRQVQTPGATPTPEVEVEQVQTPEITPEPQANPQQVEQNTDPEAEANQPSVEQQIKQRTPVLTKDGWTTKEAD